MIGENSKPKCVGLIPARWNSERLPGKPLADIGGFPMIYHVAKRAMLSSLIDSVYVCTDSVAIVNVCLKFDIPVCLTKASCKNGTERLGDSVSKLGLSDSDVIIDIQGDEPLVDPAAIDLVCSESAKAHADIVLPHLIGCEEGNRNIVKVVESDGKVLFLTRSDSPMPFASPRILKKHLSVIGFSGKSLLQYCSLAPSPLEQIESVELLRALENGMSIRTIPIVGDSLSVDTPSDLDRVRRKMEFCPLFSEGY